MEKDAIVRHVLRWAGEDQTSTGLALTARSRSSFATHWAEYLADVAVLGDDSYLAMRSGLGELAAATGSFSFVRIEMRQTKSLTLLTWKRFQRSEQNSILIIHGVATLIVPKYIRT
jgi:hypothetical protein